MALTKTIALGTTGVSASYFKITCCVLDKKEMKLSVTLSAYLDSTKTNFDSVRLKFRQYSFDITKQQAAGNIIEFAYDAIKAIAVADNSDNLHGATDA